MVETERQPFFFNRVLDHKLNESSPDSIFFDDILQIVFLPSKECNGLFKRQYEILKHKSEQFDIIINEEYYANAKIEAIERQEEISSADNITGSYRTITLDESRTENILTNNSCIDVSIILKIIQQIKFFDENNKTIESKKSHYIIGVIPNEFLLRTENANYKFELKNKYEFERRYRQFNRNANKIDLNQVNVFVTGTYISSSIKENKFLIPRDFMVNVNSEKKLINDGKEQDPRINLHKTIVITMLEHWKSIMVQTGKMMVSSGDLSKENKFKLQTKMKDFFNIIKQWEEINENMFDFPITEEQITKFLQIDSSISLKIKFVLDYLFANEGMKVNENNIIKFWIQNEESLKLTESSEQLQKAIYFSNFFGFKNSKESIITFFTEFEDSSIEGFKNFFFKFPQKLTWQTLYCWRFYTDFTIKVSKEEIKYHKKLITNFCKQFDLDFEITSSYKHKVKNEFKEIKILLFIPNINNTTILNNRLEELVKSLINIQYVDCILGGENRILFNSMNHCREYMLNCVKENFTSDLNIFTNLRHQNNENRKHNKIIVGASLKSDWFLTNIDEFNSDVPNGVFTGASSKLKREDEIFKLDNNSKQKICRIVNLEVVPYCELNFKLLYSTSSFHFIKSLEYYCEKNEYKITDKYLFDLQDNINVTIEDGNDDSILHYLGLSDFVPLQKRDFTKFVDLTISYSIPSRMIQDISFL